MHFDCFYSIHACLGYLDTSCRWKLPKFPLIPVTTSKILLVEPPTHSPDTPVYMLTLVAMLAVFNDIVAVRSGIEGLPHVFLRLTHAAKLDPSTIQMRLLIFLRNLVVESPVRHREDLGSLGEHRIQLIVSQYITR